MQEAIHENESGVSYSERSEAAPGLALPSIEPELFMPWAVLAVEKAFLRALSRRGGKQQLERRMIKPSALSLSLRGCRFHRTLSLAADTCILFRLKVVKVSAYDVRRRFSRGFCFSGENAILTS